MQCTPHGSHGTVQAAAFMRVLLPHLCRRAPSCSVLFPGGEHEAGRASTPLALFLGLSRSPAAAGHSSADEMCMDPLLGEGRTVYARRIGSSLWMMNSLVFSYCVGQGSRNRHTREAHIRGESKVLKRHPEVLPRAANSSAARSPPDCLPESEHGEPAFPWKSDREDTSAKAGVGPIMRSWHRNSG